MEEAKVLYNNDWSLQEIPEIHPKWYKLENQVDLNFCLSTREFKEMVREVLKKLKYKVNEENLKETYKTIITYTKILMADVSTQLSDPFYEHFNNYYPVVPVGEEIYTVLERRKAYLEMIRISKLRENLFKVKKIEGSRVFPPNLIDEFHKNNFKEIKRVIESQHENPNLLRDPVPPIVLVGVDYSARGLRKELCNESFPREEELENYSEVEYAEYSLGVGRIATELSIQLLEFGLMKWKGSFLHSRKLLETLIEELDHRRCDLYLSIEKEELEELSKQLGCEEKTILFYRTPRYGFTQTKIEHTFLRGIGGKNYGYNGAISKFIMERGQAYAGKLKLLIKFFIEEKLRDK
ncbi:MAG: hypothetical protein QW040_03985 [Candidatus Aenigmatarchaeota archaeon]